MSEAPGEMHDWYEADLDPEEFRRLGYQAVDMIADYYSDIRSDPVFPPHTSKEVAQAFDEPLPETGQEPEAVLAEWTDKVLPYTTKLGSPRYFGFVNGSGTMLATLAEALAASVNMNVGAWKPAPAATEIERRTIAWIAELIGYAQDCGGFFTSGGTMANFTAVLTGLRNTAPFDTTQVGLQGSEQQGRFTLYMADHEGHVSITRVADMLNLGRQAVRLVPSHDDLTMDVEALQRMLQEDRARGDIPFCVVGQAGSINTSAVDPLDAIAGVCASQGLWFHVDGANGAFGAMLPERREDYAGLERADSITLDPHKWLFVPYECGCVLVGDPEKLRRAFSLSAPYLRGTLPTEYTGLDYLEYGPQMSRGFRALKVWMGLKHHGAAGYRKLLKQGIRCAEHLDGLVRAAPDFEAMQQPNLFIYCFRYAPPQVSGRGQGSNPRAGELLDELNQLIADRIQVDGTAFVMTSKLRGRVVLRLSICSHRTTPEDMEVVFERLREIGAELLAERGLAHD